MTTGWLVFILGILLGAGIAGTIMYRAGYRGGHLHGYQDHRAEVNELKNAADTRNAPGAEPGEIHVKTTRPGSALPPGWFEHIPPAVPAGGRPLPSQARWRLTSRGDVEIEFKKPQSAPDPGPLTAGMPAVSTTGELRAITDAWVAKTRTTEDAWRQERGLA
jgi:hypothetical protein